MDTKNKILKIAGHLFAESGFDGVSIRDIAERASVNVSAVNYHFGGKQELFDEILAEGAQALSLKIKSICERSNSLSHYGEQFFDETLKESDSLKTIVRMQLSSTDLAPEFIERHHSHSESFPPGVNFLVDLVQNVHKVENRKEARVIATIYHFQLIQSALVTFYTGFKDLSAKQPNEHSPKVYKEHLSHLAKCLVEH
jgi:AcrR family transcriptional regulator